MADNLVSGAVIYRKKHGVITWFVTQPKSKEGNGDWELPKILVRPGGSSVQAILRYLREDGRLKVTVLEEAGRTTISTTANGVSVGTKIIFYLLRGGFIREEGEGPISLEGDWLPYAKARRKLSLVREQRFFSQANMVLKEWYRRKKRNPEKRIAGK
ncbi:hypothetical protein CMO96_04885 [Candidatus Woesebacteria bacterium]|nr:hypothetical protein [Candidatus Woesebacteria bacterium]